MGPSNGITASFCLDLPESTATVWPGCFKSRKRKIQTCCIHFTDGFSVGELRSAGSNSAFDSSKRSPYHLSSNSGLSVGSTAVTSLGHTRC